MSLFICHFFAFFPDANCYISEFFCNFADAIRFLQGNGFFYADLTVAALSLNKDRYNGRVNFFDAPIISQLYPKRSDKSPTNED